MIWAIFQIELLQAIRRGRGHFLRWIYVLFLLAQIIRMLFITGFYWHTPTFTVEFFTFLDVFFQQHCLFLALLVPAMVAGAVAEEKTHGRLQHLLIASADPAAIVAGKLLFHLFQLGFWLLTGLPVFVLFAVIGREFYIFATLLAGAIAILFGVTALSILFSAWCRTTRETIVGVYLGLGVAMLIQLRLADIFWWFAWFHPAHVLPLHARMPPWQALWQFMLAWTCLGGFCSLLAAALLRPVYLRQLQAVERVPGQPRRTARRIHGNPVAWCDTRVAPIMPGWARGAPPGTGVLVVVMLTILALGVLLFTLSDSMDKAWNLLVLGNWPALILRLAPRADAAFFREGLAAFLIMVLVVAVRASASITSEKERGTWLALMVTTLTTREIVSGKFWGIVGACVPYVAAHAAVVIPLGMVFGAVPTAIALTTLLLMLVVVFLGGAIGLWCSSRAASSWRSLALTVTFFYLGMAPALLLWVSPVLVEAANRKGIESLPFWLAATPSLTPWALFIGISFGFWILGRGLLITVHATISRKDRWEMGIEPEPRKEVEDVEEAEDTWEKTAKAWKPPVTVASTLTLTVCETLHSVTAREVKRALLAEGRRDEDNAVRHFLAGGHMFMVLAEEYADNAQFDMALRSRENAICCFWRAGHERQARLLFSELKQDNPIFAGDIDSIVLDLQQNVSGWGPYH